ncbi:hypothetical protein SAMN05421819_2571 [Bryocella elongata]|uniref:Uncharacterized protein n=1 Tax=Bryocella elongata TaxID=863522 RepID=A0A1H5ZDK9_9BACT|nr:hypothetical protein [Bryocella elongata]SEG33815.1 hypothetical protein SAMN05421819_2571 [Bryocella elongata]
MTLADFNSSLSQDDPPVGLPLPLQSLWWDAKGDWDRAHALVNDLGTPDAMSVHAYLHRKEGDEANASYWYRRAGSGFRRPTLAQEWAELVAAQLADED